MTTAQRLTLKRSEIRERLAEIGNLEGDDYSEEVQAEESKLQNEFRSLETRYRSAIISEEGAAQKAEARFAAGGVPDSELRERIDLRGKASLLTYFTDAAKGRAHRGAEAELNAAAEIGEGIPLELWDVPTGDTVETRAITAAPGTVGVNLDPIRPAVFASSIAPRLGIEMPRVKSGTYASATITTSQTAAARDKSAAAVGNAGGFTVTTATPKRVSARLELAIEDVAAVGQANFESILRENLSMVLSDELDDQIINGGGSAPNLIGMFQRLTDPTGSPTAIAKFDDFVGKFCAGVEGLWASRTNEVAIVAGPETYRLSAKTFRDGPTDDRGDTPFSSYAETHTGGWWTNSRMPDKVSHVQQAILHRKGRSGMRTAVCPHWNEIGIDDIYSGSAKGERYFTLHVLLGDVILVQPNAYTQVQFRVST